MKKSNKYLIVWMLIPLIVGGLIAGDWSGAVCDSLFVGTLFGALKANGHIEN